VFVVHAKATEWPKKLEDVPGPVHSLKLAITHDKVRITAVEGLPGVDEEGDLLIFPSRLGVKHGYNQADVVAHVSGETKSVPGAKPLNGPQVMVCAHATRDKRCADCGPELTVALAKALGAGATVRKCSHIGGHVYAGNAIVFRPSGAADWLSYLTPCTACGEAAWAFPTPSTLRWPAR